MLHGVALVVVVAYDMYLEAASGSLNPEWKIEKPMDFHQFRDRLSGQMLKYDPTKRVYSGDSQFRVATQQHKKRRMKSSGRYGKKGRLSANTVASGGTFCLDVEEYGKALKSGRLCKNITELQKHLSDFQPNKSKSGRVCHWCGDLSYTVCNTCGIALHNFPSKGPHQMKACSLYYHDPECFGLGFMDCKLLQSKKGITWQNPSFAARKANKKHIDDNITPEL